MTYQELKVKLYDLVGEYFAALRGQGNIVWSMAKAVNPNSPMVSLQLGQLNRHYMPTRLDINGVPVDNYQSYTTLQVDLFTKGAAITDEANITAARENTAVNDMIDFVNFLNSAYVDHWCLINDVSIQGNAVRDLTQLINSTSWDYRAMIELEIGFTQNAVGYTGIMFEGGVLYDEDGNLIPEPPPFETTSSGGRSKDLADQYTGWFEQVETEHVEEDILDGK